MLYLARVSFILRSRQVNWLMNPMKKVVNLNVNRVHSELQWLTLQEASKITGLNTFTIRKRIKTGKLLGKKVNQKNKEVWFVSADDVKNSSNVDGERLKLKVNDELVDELVNDEPVHQPAKKAQDVNDLLLREKDERIGELVHHKNILEVLLKDFQAHMMILESERNELDRQVKLLPAPPETVSTILQNKEQALLEAQEAVSRLEAELRQERNMPWWKKMFRKR